MLATTWLGCAHTQHRRLVGGDPEEQVATVSIDYDQSSDTWTVQYHLPEPVHEITFWRNRTRLRTKSWHIVSPTESLWAQADGRERVRFGAPVSDIVLSFRSNTANQFMDYSLNQRFSNGDALLFGPFLLIEDSSGSAPLEAHVQASGSAELIGADGLSGYLYAGSIPTERWTAVEMVVDPALPDWIRSSLEEDLPALFAEYQRTTGQDLPFVPVLFVSFEDGAESEAATLGGTRGRQAQLHVAGGYWHHDDAWSRFTWTKFLAHETFHFWNETLVGSLDG
ncbi:MAG: hypothetical protein KC561_17925, partial [Myxococcales bacterium]|nr:hypothetical protein [Myxococcales bacterium]